MLKECKILETIPRNSFSVSELARYCGVSRQTITSILKSEKSPSVQLALKICEYFNQDSVFRFSVEDFWRC